MFVFLFVAWTNIPRFPVTESIYSIVLYFRFFLYIHLFCFVLCVPIGNTAAAVMFKMQYTRTSSNINMVYMRLTNCVLQLLLLLLFTPVRHSFTPNLLTNWQQLFIGPS